MTYSVDTSAITQGWRKYYPPGVFPRLWDDIDGLIRSGDLRAAEYVKIELDRKDDEILDWAKQRPGLFVPFDANIQVAVKAILREHPRLLDSRKNRSGADPFVIALAQINNCAVVTDERPTANPNKPHIPDVCKILGVRCINLLGLITECGWSY